MNPLGRNLELKGILPVEVSLAGITISRGMGRHVARVTTHYVLIFVRQGTLHVEEEGVEFEVEAGESLILWPGQHHRGSRPYGDDLQFFWVHFNLPSPSEMQWALDIPQHKKVARPDFVNELFRRFLDDESAGHSTPLGKALFLSMIFNEIAEVRPDQVLRSSVVLAGEAQFYIRTHFHQKISSSDVAQALGYNARYLGRVYRQTYGMSVAESIRLTRVEHARNLLLNSSYSLREISRLAGFKDVTYFQRVFKQIKGITPLAYRKLHARMTVTTD